MSQSFNLYQLERIDTRKDQLLNRVEQVQKEIDDRKNIDLLENKIINLETMREDLLERIGELDLDVQNKKIRINQSEASLYGGKVQNPKELLALQTEIESLSKNVIEKEATLTSMMGDFESIEKDLIQMQTKLDGELSAKEILINQLKLEKINILKDLEKVESERLVAVSQIKIDHLNTYEEIRRKKKNIAVSIVEDDTCSACGVSITPSEWQAARSPDVVVFCPSCSRILYAG